MIFNFAAVLLLAAASSVRADPQRGLRSLQAGQGEQHFNEKIIGPSRTCIGATCGMWGDPHIITCDGLSYDCQGKGIFQLMQNDAYSIQANFRDVGEEEKELTDGWGFSEGATVTNDIMVKFLLNPEAPIFQLGYPDLSNHDGTYPAEEGCLINKFYKSMNMVGTKSVKLSSVEQCRNLCAETSGCARFTFFQDRRCFRHDGSSRLMKSHDNWSRSLAGTMESTCGTHPPDMELKEQEERLKHGNIGKNCPLLMWADGEMVDISKIVNNGFLYGESGDDITVEMKGGKEVFITHKMPDGESDTVIRLKSQGKGPGNLWSCHWDFYVCLPATEERMFVDSKGLLGSPDNKTENDWMTPNGDLVKIERTGGNRHKTMIDYCYNNWCVPQHLSLMSHHADTDYGDAKCEHEDHNPGPFDRENPKCVLTADKIKKACENVIPMMRYGCEFDCCWGGCDDMHEVEEDLKELDKKKTDIIFDLISNDCGDDLRGTPELVCPTSEGGIIKLLRSTGSTPLPAGVDIFYGIVQDPDPDDSDHTLVRFKISNPFDSSADVYVKHDKSVATAFTASVCDGFPLDAGGCDDGKEIEVACKDFEGIEPFALVSVYFASPSVVGDATIHQCCEAGDYDSSTTGVVEYTFQIECTCPDAQTS